MNWPEIGAIVIPIDFSEESFRALDCALALAAEPSRVHVVHVMDEPTVGRCQALGPDAVGIEQLQLKQAVSERLSHEKYREVQIEISCGEPGLEIAKFAIRVKASLIVMPSHGRGGLRHPLLIGSVAERVVRLSPCPVLILKDLGNLTDGPFSAEPSSSCEGPSI